MTHRTRTEMESGREVWTADMDADQATLSETVNTYAIILGQAQVVKSVTTSDAARKLVGNWSDWEDGGGGRCDEPIARVEPQCDDGAVWVQPSGTVGERDTGRTVSEQNQNVRTPRRDAAGQIVGTRYRTGGWTMRRLGVMVDGTTIRHGQVRRVGTEVWTMRYGSADEATLSETVNTSLTII
ncbi:MAG: hypothetical protein IPL32_20580 [Chloracidobacterium sp.]|nr:hypothetical protein [Chloracidobacterium sp.]